MLTWVTTCPCLSCSEIDYMQYPPGNPPPPIRYMATRRPNRGPVSVMPGPEPEGP